MCFVQSQCTSKEELQELHWKDLSVNDDHVDLTYEELMILFYEYQWELYTELHDHVEAAGGELTIDHYTKLKSWRMAHTGMYWAWRCSGDGVWMARTGMY